MQWEHLQMLFLFQTPKHSHSLYHEIIFLNKFQLTMHTQKPQLYLCHEIIDKQLMIIWDLHTKYYNNNNIIIIIIIVIVEVIIIITTNYNTKTAEEVVMW